MGLRLINFKKIFVRSDYTFISEKSHIRAVEKLLRHGIRYPDAHGREDFNFLNDYAKEEANFYGWLTKSMSDKQIPDQLSEGHALVQKVLDSAKVLSLKSIEERKAISGRHCAKMKRDFLRGLKKIYQGLKVLMDPQMVGPSKVTADQYQRYILDDKEGMAKKFKFNSSGANNFVGALNGWSRPLVIAAAKSLKVGPERPKWLGSDYDKYGVGSAGFRLYAKGKYVKFAVTNPGHAKNHLDDAVRAGRV